MPNQQIIRTGTMCLFILLLTFGCQNKHNEHNINNETTKQDIINILKNETKYFCERNLEEWQSQWSHEPFVYKMYAGNNAFEEFVGWEEINQFTVQHIEENPTPIPLPDTNFDYDIYLFGETAWVLYSKNVDGALARETRFMVKENNKWKIARMQTIF
ncbi:MAG: hypothetical protein AB8B69_03260 [Chitinophagales bacterium]